jgi:hypothetical protein
VTRRVVDDLGAQRIRDSIHDAVAVAAGKPAGAADTRFGRNATRTELTGSAPMALLS